MRIASARLFVGGIAALALLLPGTVPSWAAEPSVTVTGVIQLDGKPTAGIEVCDLFDDSSCATTAADGTYTVKSQYHQFDGPGGTQSRNCLAVRPGPTLEDVFESITWMKRLNTECGIRITGEAGTTVTRNFEVTSYPFAWGQVVNTAGQPIVGASVASGRGRAASLTDSQGRFRVKMGPYNYDEHYLTISAEGYQMTGSRFAKSGDLGKIVMAAEGAGTWKSIGGRVLDAAGRPYAGVRVCLADGGCIATVDSDGNYFGLVSLSVMGAVDFKLYRPESSTPVLMSQDLYFNVGNLMTNVDFRLNSARRIVGQTPTISGSPKIGKRLTVNTGTWLPQPVAISCRWYVGSKVVKSSCSSLKVKAAYRGKRISVRVTGTRAGYPSKVLASRASSRVYR